MVEIVSVPFIFAIAMFLPGNIVLPFATILATSAIVPGYIAFKGDIVKMFITNLCAIPIFLWVATYFTPMITDIGVQAGAVAAGESVAWFAMNVSTFRWMITESIVVNPFAIGVCALYVGLAVWFFKAKAKEDRAREQASLSAEA